MSIEGQKFSYPGDDATPLQLIELADQYRRGAQTLRSNHRRGKPLSSAPFRLVTLQAIELYLNAFMLKCGCLFAEVRGLQHNFSARASFVKDNGLALRARTVQHLHDLHVAREYLTIRYGPELSRKQSELNRLEATLKDVAEKVSESVKEQ